MHAPGEFPLHQRQSQKQSSDTSAEPVKADCFRLFRPILVCCAGPCDTMCILCKCLHDADQNNVTYCKGKGRTIMAVSHAGYCKNSSVHIQCGSSVFANCTKNSLFFSG